MILPVLFIVCILSCHAACVGTTGRTRQTMNSTTTAELHSQCGTISVLFCFYWHFIQLFCVLATDFSSHYVSLQGLIPLLPSCLLNQVIIVTLYLATFILLSLTFYPTVSTTAESFLCAWLLAPLMQYSTNTW